MIRAARLDELTALFDLAMRSKAVWGHDDAFLDACRDELRLSPAHLPRTFVTCLRSTICGFATFSDIGDRRAELDALFVEPDAIGHGHGRALVQHVVGLLRADRFRVLEIQGDPHADGFYRSLGAVRVGDRPSASIPGRWLPLYELPIGD